MGYRHRRKKEPEALAKLVEQQYQIIQTKLAESQQELAAEQKIAQDARCELAVVEQRHQNAQTELAQSQQQLATEKVKARDREREIAVVEQQYQNVQTELAQTQQRLAAEQMKAQDEECVMAQRRENFEEEITKRKRAVRQEMLQYENDKESLLRAQEHLKTQLQIANRKEQEILVKERIFADEQSALKYYHEQLKTQEIRMNQTMAYVEQQYDILCLENQEIQEKIEQDKVRLVREKELALQEVIARIGQERNLLPVQDAHVMQWFEISVEQDEIPTPTHTACQNDEYCTNEIKRQIVKCCPHDMKLFLTSNFYCVDMLQTQILKWHPDRVRKGESDEAIAVLKNRATCLNQTLGRLIAEENNSIPQTTPAWLVWKRDQKRVQELGNLRAEIQRQNGELLNIRGGECRIQDLLMAKKEEIKRLKRTIDECPRTVGTLTFNDAGTQTSSEPERSNSHSNMKNGNEDLGGNQSSIDEELFRTFPNYARMSVSRLRGVLQQHDIDNHTSLLKGKEHKDDLVAMLTLIWFKLDLCQTCIEMAKSLWGIHVQTLRSRVTGKEPKHQLVVRILLEKSRVHHDSRKGSTFII